VNTSRTASKTRGLVARLLAVLASIALVFGFVPAASAATGPISGTQATNSTEYYNVLRTNSNAQNIIQFKWNGNNAGGGGLNFMITTNTNVVMGSVTGSYNVWLTMRNSRANTQWFPSGGFTPPQRQAEHADSPATETA
jgi:predicted PurR-regulated permease PerM